MVHLSDKFLDHKRLVADPEADRMIEDLVRTNGIAESRRLFDMLIRETEMPVGKLPTPIRAYIEQNQHMPGWAEQKKIHMAQELFIDHGPKFLMFLYFKSLPLLYSMRNGVQVLIKTGRLAHSQQGQLIFTRRIAETGQFLLEVMSPGGFEKPYPAVSAALKIRLIHASIRHFLIAGKWNVSIWGQPINQEDMAATLMTFSVTMTEALKQFKIPVTPEEEDAYLHHWQIIGHLMGINHDLLPDHAREGKELLSKILKRQSAFSEEGVTLTRALTSFISNHVESGFLRRSPHVLIRYLAGKTIAKRLGVKRDRYWWLYILLPAFLRWWFRMGESLEEKFGFLERFADQNSRKLVIDMVGYFDTYKQRNFCIPKPLRKAWRIE